MNVIKDANKRQKKIKRTQITQRKNDSDYFGLFLMDETSRHSPGVLYYYWYQKFIQDLIYYDLAYCKWMDFHDEIIPLVEKNQNRMIFSEDNLKERFALFKGNPFLIEYKDAPVNLAKDIVENGMYVPFLFGEVAGEIIMKNGSHRLNSLANYSRTVAPIHKKYPCIIFKDKKIFEKFYLLPWMYSGFAFYVPISNGVHLTQLFDLNGGEVSKYVFMYNKAVKNLPFLANLKEITPAEAFNNEDKWEEFIKRPLDNNDFNEIIKDYALGNTDSLVAFQDIDKYAPKISRSFDEDFRKVMNAKPILHENKKWEQTE